MRRGLEVLADQPTDRQRDRHGLDRSFAGSAHYQFRDRLSEGGHVTFVGLPGRAAAAYFNLRRRDKRRGEAELFPESRERQDSRRATIPETRPACPPALPLIFRRLHSREVPAMTHAGSTSGRM